MKITCVQLYDFLARHWLSDSIQRLQRNVLPKEDQEVLNQLLEAGFITKGIAFSKRLATAMFEHQDGNPVVQYVHVRDKKTWRAEFFGTDPEARMLRESIPLTRIGSQHRFLH